MSKITNHFLKVSLIIMILLSLFLSWKIWTKPANHSLANKHDKNITDLSQTKKITDVYVPTKLIYHKSENDFWYTNKEKTVLEVNEKIQSLDLRLNDELNEKSIQTAIYEDDSICLTFPDELPLSFYSDIHELHLEIPNKMEDLDINRIICSFSKQELYFINAKEDVGLSYDISGNMSSIKKSLGDEDQNNYQAVSLTADNIGGIYYLEDDIKLKTYSYIVATQSFTTFTKAFFNQSGDLYSNDSENVNLSNKEGESLSIQADTGEVKYFGKLQTDSEELENETYFDSYQYVENLGSAMGTLRFFNVTKSDITFRNYIEGFPVFGKDMKGLLEVDVQNITVFVRTNQETLQIPIPSEETVTLIKTSSLMDQIAAHGGDMSLISDAQIGYEWQANDETKQAVDLVPTWFIKYEDTWYSLSALLNKLNQGGTN